MSDRVFIIGAGKVGRGLARAFRAAGVTVAGLHARRAQPEAQGSTSDEATSRGEFPVAMRDANVILLAVRDGQIDEVVRELITKQRARGRLLAHGAVVLHTSGTAEPREYPALRALRVDAGTFHPLVPFATAERGAELLRDAWIGIDGDANACAAGRRLAAALGARTVNIPSGAKARYHAAAVIASNFPIVLAALAADVLADAGVERQTAQQVVQSLMLAAVENLANRAPAEALTGPVVRGDHATIAAHLQALQRVPEALEVYRVLTRIAEKLVSA